LHAAAFGEAAHIAHLRLNETSERVVAVRHHQIRFRRERSAMTTALAHAAGELVRDSRPHGVSSAIPTSPSKATARR
jgi:hypothetical protein